MKFIKNNCKISTKITDTENAIDKRTNNEFKETLQVLYKYMQKNLKG